MPRVGCQRCVGRRCILVCKVQYCQRYILLLCQLSWLHHCHNSILLRLVRFLTPSFCMAIKLYNGRQVLFGRHTLNLSPQRQPIINTCLPCGYESISKYNHFAVGHFGPQSLQFEGRSRSSHLLRSSGTLDLGNSVLRHFGTQSLRAQNGFARPLRSSGTINITIDCYRVSWKLGFMLLSFYNLSQPIN